MAILFEGVVMCSRILKTLKKSMWLSVLSLLSSAAFASGYPAKPITLIFPWSVGSGIDAVTRDFAQRLEKELGQPIVVVSKPGAASTIGALEVVRAAPDGYTLLIGDGGTFSVVNSLRRSPLYDATTDFTPVSLLVRTPYFVLTGPDSSFDNLQDFVTQAKARPGQIAYGNVGIGSLAHLAVADFSQKAEIDLITVPYKGSGEVLVGLQTGEIQFSFTGGALTHIHSGRVKGLAVTSAERLAAAPELPTLHEVTGADTVAEAWWGIVAPKGTPADVVETLNKAIGKVAAQEDLREKFAAWGFVFGASTPQALTERIVSQRDLWADVITAASIPTVD